MDKEVAEVPRDYAALPHEYLEEMEALNDGEFGRLCRALLRFSMTGTEEQLGGNERFYLKRVYMREKRYQENYADTVNSRREAGKKGANARWQREANDSNGMANDGNAMAPHGVATQDMAADGKNGYSKSESKSNSNTKSNNPPISPLQGDTVFGPELQEAFNDWLVYKQEKRQGYKPKGLQNLISEVRNNAAKYGEKAVADLIRKCMASNWQGIIFDRLSGLPTQQNRPDNRRKGSGDQLLDMIRSGAFDE